MENRVLPHEATLVAAAAEMCEKVVEVSFETSLFENPVSVLTRIGSSFLLEVKGSQGLSYLVGLPDCQSA